VAESGFLRYAKRVWALSSDFESASRTRPLVLGPSYRRGERALQRKDARFVGGMIGSETKAAKLRSRLNARGVDASRLASPIGLFKAGKHPAEVAVSAVTQLLQAVSPRCPLNRGKLDVVQQRPVRCHSFAQLRNLRAEITIGTAVPDPRQPTSAASAPSGCRTPSRTVGSTKPANMDIAMAIENKSHA
jgi:XdhC/CoxI family protein